MSDVAGREVGAMSAVLWFLVGALVPVLILAVADAAARWGATDRGPRALRPLVAAWERGRRGRPPVRPLPTVLLELEVRRLGDQLAAVEAGEAPHQAARLAAARVAYDRALLDLAARAELALPVARPPLGEAVRLDLEAALLGAGHVW